MKGHEWGQGLGINKGMRSGRISYFLASKQSRGTKWLPTVLAQAHGCLLPEADISTSWVLFSSPDRSSRGASEEILVQACVNHEK